MHRDPTTGTRHPRLPSVLKMTHLTAERRVRAIFYWAHVLGTKADVIHVADARRHAQAAVATLQIILIATRGHRPYTPTELEFIFHDLGRQFFISLEQLAVFTDAKRMTSGAEAHRRQPTRVRAPREFTTVTRFDCKLTTSSV
jgi:hypothetical protein